MAKKRTVVRVVPDGAGGWKVTQGGQTVSKHRKKSAAIERGRSIAKGQKPSQIVIHKKDGKIQTEHTYQSDPRPPKG